MRHVTAGGGRPGTTSRGLGFWVVSFRGILTAVTAAVLVLLPAAPANAGEPADLRLEVRQGNLQSQAGGQPATLVFAITNDGPSKADAFNANVVIPFGDRGIYLASSSPGCNQVGGPTVLACPVNELEVGQTTVFTLVIGAPQAGSLQPTDSLSAAGQIAIDAGGDDPNGANDGSQFTLNLTGAPTVVAQVGGTVKDGNTGLPIVGASVVTRDVNGATCVSTTDATGTFACAANPPLAGGQLTIEATMAGYQLSRTTVTPTNGTVPAVALALSPVAPSASPTPSAVPSSPAAAASPQPQSLATDEDGFDWDVLLLVLGILVVLAGLGAVGWWIYQRKDKDSGPTGGATPSGLPDLVAAESIMPTMPLRVPSSVLSDTTMANRPFNAPELPGGSGALAGGPVGGNNPNASTAVWSAHGVADPSRTPGNWAPSGDPAEAGQYVNRSTEPIQVSGAGWLASSSEASQSSASQSPAAQRTAEWPTIDPAPGHDQAPAVASAPPAPGEQTTVWPHAVSAPPVPTSAVPASAPPAFAAPASAPPASHWDAPNQPANQSWGAPAQPAAQDWGGATTPAVPATPPAAGVGAPYEARPWGTPGRAYGSTPAPDAPVGGWEAPLAGWDTPPATPPTPMSGPPVSGLPVSGLPVSGLPVSGLPGLGPPLSGPPVSGPPVAGYPTAPGQPPARSMSAASAPPWPGPASAPPWTPGETAQPPWNGGETQRWNAGETPQWNSGGAPSWQHASAPPASYAPPSAYSAPPAPAPPPDPDPDGPDWSAHRYWPPADPR